MAVMFLVESFILATGLSRPRIDGALLRLVPISTGVFNEGAAVLVTLDLVSILVVVGAAVVVIIFVLFDILARGFARFFVVGLIGWKVLVRNCYPLGGFAVSVVSRAICSST